MNEEKNNSGGQVQIKTSNDVLKGEYSNMANIHHTKEEFVLDFLNVFPPAGTLSSRVIVSPGHFKRMVGAMQDNLKKYEEKFGTLSTSQSPTESERTIGFHTDD